MKTINPTFEDLEMASTDNYPSIIYKHDFVKEMQTERIDYGYELDAPEYCGYTLIANYLVHETFIKRVIDDLETCKFESGVIFAEEYLFNTDFLDSLDNQEQDVLMDLALLLLKERIEPAVYEDMYACAFGRREI